MGETQDPLWRTLCVKYHLVDGQLVVAGIVCVSVQKVVRYRRVLAYQPRPILLELDGGDNRGVLGRRVVEDGHAPTHTAHCPNVSSTKVRPRQSNAPWLTAPPRPP